MGNWDGRSSRQRSWQPSYKRKYGQRGRRRSHVSFSTRLYKATHGDFNPNIRPYAILGIFIFLIVGGVALYQTPAFHSYTQTRIPLNKLVTPLTYSIPGDPYTILWHATDAKSDGSEFNLRLATDAACPGGFVGLSRCLTLSANSTDYAIALSQIEFDISTISAKQLIANNYWGWSGSCCGLNQDWGWYLTTNGTLPTGNAAHSYSPFTDTSVAMIEAEQATGGGNFAGFVWIQKNEFRTITQDDTGSCAPSSDCFLSSTTNSQPAQNTNTINQVVLNFTGAVDNTHACGYQSIGLGPNCSYQGIDTTHAGTSQVKPGLEFQGRKYFIGYYAQSGLTSTNIIWAFDPTASPCSAMCLSMYVPTAVTPTAPSPITDTGGLFGPIIRWLINGAVYMGQNIINFFQFLYNLLGPLISNAINSLAGLMTSIFNAIGGVFGYNTLGNQLVGLVADFASFLTNSFRNLTGIVSNIVTFINNAATFITQFFTNTSFTNLLFGEIGALVNVWTVINGIWGDFAKWFVAGTLSIAAILEIDWVLGTLWTAVEGWKGFREWLDLNELIIIRLFGLAYWMFELGLDVAFKLIMIIKGRVLWFQVMAEG